MAIAALASCGTKVHDPELDRAAIENALRQWPIDFNAENVDGVCGLFAEDAVVAYPGGPDRNRGEFCDRMRKLFDDPAKTFSYDAPDIDEVMIDGDLATVQLKWKLTVRDKSGKLLETGDEDGLDVFKRQPGGGWKIHVSHAFTQE
jgi:ketosteroid isomerase-like protein